MKLVAYWSATMNDSTKLAALVGVFACACSGGSIENGAADEGQQPGGVGQQQDRVQRAEAGRVLHRVAHEDERAEQRQAEQPDRAERSDAALQRSACHLYQPLDMCQPGEM